MSEPPAGITLGRRVVVNPDRWISSPLSATIWFSGALCLAVLGDWAPRDVQ